MVRMDTPADSKIEAVRDIATQGQRIPIDKLTNLPLNTYVKVVEGSGIKK